MSMTIQGISTAVQTLLEDSDLFADVLAAPQEGETLNFSGYPAVMHYFSGADNDYATNTQNRRAVTYAVEAVIVSPDTVTPVDRFKKAYALADNIISTLDASSDLGGACQIMRPVPGAMERVTTNEGDGLIISFTLVCEDDITFRSA